MDRTRVELTTSKVISEMTIDNIGETSTLVQTQVFSWSQVDGVNNLEPSEDLLVSPPIA